MAIVRITIEGKDRMVGAMVKALAVEVSGFRSVTGATMKFLAANGFYEFRFPTESRADKFRDAVRRYLPVQFAHVINE